MHPDSIILTVPARSDYAKTVRMTAAQLASRLGMSFDQVDDVRIAAEEAFVYACERMAETEDVTFTFLVSDDALEVTVGPLPECVSPEATQAADNYAEFILRSVCDDFSLDRESGECHLRLACRVADEGDAGA
jgi:serine/threonine-protein kinase RsbW